MRAAFNDIEAIVVGGGPAGLAAAIALRMEGLAVMVVDRRVPPIDKACGEGIMPDGVALLARIGVCLPAGAAIPFRGIRFLEGGIVATGLFRGEHGIGVERTVLHAALARRAREAGVDLRWGTPALSFRDDGIETPSGPITARWIVAADGERSRARAWLGIDAGASARRRGMRRHFDVSPWTDLVEVHWSTRCEAYVTPVAAGRVCVAMITDEAGLRFDDALARFPGLARRLGSARGAGDDRGGATVLRRPSSVARGRYALVGDAAGSVDAITGEGITLALHQAAMLAASLRSGGLDAYARACRRLMRAPALMASLMLAIDRRGPLRRAVLRSLAAAPEAFATILDFHTRRRPSGRRPHAPVLPLPVVMGGAWREDAR